MWARSFAVRIACLEWLAGCRYISMPSVLLVARLGYSNYRTVHVVVASCQTPVLLSCVGHERVKPQDVTASVCMSWIYLETRSCYLVTSCWIQRGYDG